MFVDCSLPSLPAVENDFRKLAFIEARHDFAEVEMMLPSFRRHLFVNLGSRVPREGTLKLEQITWRISDLPPVLGPVDLTPVFWPGSR